MKSETRNFKNGSAKRFSKSFEMNLDTLNLNKISSCWIILGVALIRVSDQKDVDLVTKFGVRNTVGSPLVTQF